MASNNTPNQVVPPALPQATNEYDRRFQDQYSNVLRLFFNSLDNAVNAMLNTDSGGAVLFMPHATFYSAANQTAVTVDTGTPIGFGELFGGNSLGLSVSGVGDSTITVSKPGAYSFQLTLQVFKSSGAAGEITVWVAVNGVAVAYSAQLVSFVDKTADQLVYAFTLGLTANDEVQFLWATTNLGIRLESSIPNVVHPGIPSATVNIAFSSNLGV